jgi:hypothetical protein
MFFDNWFSYPQRRALGMGRPPNTALIRQLVKAASIMFSSSLTASLQEQFQRHCFVKIHQQDTQPMLVPFVDPVVTFIYNRKNLDWYMEREFKKQQALPAAAVDELLEAQEAQLQLTASPVDPEVILSDSPAAPKLANIFDELLGKQ